jgi:hypothetical protein
MTEQPVKDTITIGKVKYPVTRCELKQADLRFYPENPRVYSILNNSSEDPSQEEIEEEMCKMEHVKELRISIESNGGLTDPLIVKGNIVLEGNSRLAAYRILNKTQPAKWGLVKCMVLPSDISDEAVFTLLGQYHIIGRKDWEPFEQATYLFRRLTQTKTPIAILARDLGVSAKKAEQMVDVVKFMKMNNDVEKKHWSHYEEYLKNSGIKKFRETSPDMDATIASAIKSGEIEKASDIRCLGDVAKVGDKQSKTLMQKVATGDLTLYEAHEKMKATGKLVNVVKELKKHRNFYSDPDSLIKQINVSEDTRQQAVFEINKIWRSLKKIKDAIGN